MNNRRITAGITRALYEEDSYISECTAKVLECQKTELADEDNQSDRYRLVLDRTVFFPEGGGQPADSGTIAGQPVIDVQKKDGKIYHYVSDSFEVGAEVLLQLDFALRYKRMQNHSGEHLFCGLIHERYGYDNVGFHMSAHEVTVDVNGVLTADDLKELEDLANDAVYANVPIRVVYPDSPDEMEYRSKLDLKDDIRVVVIEGYDACACCAPHVRSTGEIGLLKVVDAMNHRGGTRLTLKCGKEALEDYRMLQDEISKIMRLFSAKREECHVAAERISEQLFNQREQISVLKKQITLLHKDMLCASVAAKTEKMTELIFDENLDDVQMRTLVNEGALVVTGMIGGFLGNDEAGYRYIIGKNAEDQNHDLRLLAKTMNEALHGRGGGSDKMIQGSVKAVRAEIEAFFKEVG